MSTKQLSKLIGTVKLPNINARMRLCRNFHWQANGLFDTKNVSSTSQKVFANQGKTKSKTKLISQAGIIHISKPFSSTGLITKVASMRLSTQCQRNELIRCVSTYSLIKNKNCNKTFSTLLYTDSKKHFCTEHLVHQKDKPTLVHDTNSLDNVTNHSDLIEASDDIVKSLMLSDMLVYENFIDKHEEESLFQEAENYLKRLRYEFNHWDNAIHGFRETEKRNWKEINQKILERVRNIAFPPGSPQMSLVHVLDLAKDGYIKPHVDSVRFCGSIITGLSLLSPSVMRLKEEKNPSNSADILLQPRSLYVMRGKVRYDYTHEILKLEDSVFKGTVVPRDRRISVVCRVEPEDHNQG